MGRGFKFLCAGPLFGLHLPFPYYLTFYNTLIINPSTPNIIPQSIFSSHITIIKSKLSTYNKVRIFKLLPPHPCNKVPHILNYFLFKRLSYLLNYMFQRFGFSSRSGSKCVRIYYILLRLSTQYCICRSLLQKYDLCPSLVEFILFTYIFLKHNFLPS